MDIPIGPPDPEILEEEIDDELVLLDPRSGQYYSLNRTASDVWRLADGEMTGEQIVAALATAYEVDANEIRADVLHAIDGFAAAGLFGSEIEAP